MGCYFGKMGQPFSYLFVRHGKLGSYQIVFAGVKSSVVSQQKPILGSLDRVVVHYKHISRYGLSDMESGLNVVETEDSKDE